MSSKQLKVLFHSNAPYIDSGYGVQTDVVTRWLAAQGHEVVISGFHGHRGTTLNLNGIKILPGSAEQWGNDIILAHYDYERPDVLMMLMDSWVVDTTILDHMPAAIWAPVDHTPIPEAVAAALRHTRWPVAMSRHGEQEMRKVGLDPFYVPHMVETTVYKPGDRAAARAAFGVTGDRFMAVTVAANKGFPSRKMLDKLLLAWKLFLDKQPGGVLYIHTNPYPTMGGPDLMRIADFYGLRHRLGALQPGETLDGYDVVFPDFYRMMRGDYSPVTLNNLYNAADVFVLPSAGEGFGVPVIEAQAAGCPVVVTDWSALHELGEAGYRIPIDPVDDVAVSLLYSHYCSPKVSAIVQGLEWGFAQRGNAKTRLDAWTFAQGYDVDVVMQRHMLPAMERMAQGNADYMQFQLYRQPVQRAAIPALPDGRETATIDACKQHGHDWAKVGVWDNGVMCAPCQRQGCTAELRRDKTGFSIREDGFKPEINGIPLDIEDDPQGGVAKIVMREVATAYNLDVIDFEPGDVVIDIGAHVGVVSIYLAKKHPEISITAYEPTAANYERLVRNIEANGVKNVKPIKMAFTGDGREITLSGDPSINTGGMSAFTTPNGHSQTAVSTTLNSLFANGIERVKLLKIDCEGAEYEILQGAGDLLKRVDHLRGEFHTNARLRAMGYDADALDKLCEQYIPDVQVHCIEIGA